MTLPFRVAIPARYGSSRLPGKPLRLLGGKPLIEHVYRRAEESGAQDIVIATDDERIRAAAEGFGATVCMTAATHTSGTDRLAEAAVLRSWDDDDIVVNLQGDEPLAPPALLRQVASGLAQHRDAGIATLYTRIHNPRQVFDANIVKVVLDARGYALYFSRAPIPYHRTAFGFGMPPSLPAGIDYFRHLGIYAYRVSVLRRYARLSACMAEHAEALEQLRALWHGIRIHVQEAVEAPPPDINTEYDLAQAEARLGACL
jgi:3-deoxy-manno-octulosonate cytidylyltransferase (CMP-KDO synthetase)